MGPDTSYIQVILPVKLDWEPCYRVHESVSVGQRVRVALSGKEHIGVVSQVGITPDIEETKIKDIIEIEKGMDPVFDSEIALWRSVSSYYLCSIGETYKAAYPLAKTVTEKSAAESARKAEERAEKKKNDLITKLHSDISRLNERIDDKLAKLEECKVEKTRAKLEMQILELKAKLSVKESGLEVVTSGNNVPISAKGITYGLKGIPLVQPVLSEAQSKAYSQIKEAFAEGKTALLEGITGSGKTEIYITLAQEALKNSKNVLYLVPEIALSRQLQTRLEEAFGNHLLSFHSAETQAHKRDVASLIRHNEIPYVIIGTRSSLFLPHHDLGLIIVDEEHDTSYKQDSPSPRYNGRDAAIMLAKICNCPIILGSATPSLESLYNCLAKRYAHISLSERFYSAKDAEVEIIDTTAERKKRGMLGSFSKKLIEHINNTLDSNGQVILLRARRSYSPVVQCEECGDIPKCPSCNVTLSLHKTKVGERLVCHYCGHSEAYTGLCPKCGSSYKPVGAGTQKIEEEARTLFPTATIARLDSDTARSSKFETQAIKDFEEGKTNILIGTQIVAKGFDFKGLSLVAVIGADGILAQQDFRADERASQLLTQFRGRCGRREKKGLFVIQTSQPEHPVYTSLETGSTNQTLQLLQERKDFGFPPFCRLVNIVIKDTNQGRMFKLASTLSSLIRQGICSTVTGPYAPTIDKLNKQFIMHIRISLKRDKNLVSNKEAITKIVKDFERSYSYIGHIHLDVDPI